MPFTRFAIKKAFKGIRKRATGFVLLAILFLGVGLLQNAFVSHQIRKTTTSELLESANEIANEIYKSDKWDLVSYRQVFIPSISSWYVFSADGLLIDNEAPVPSLSNLVRFVEFPTNLIFGTPQTITSEVGGVYRLLARKIDQAVVIVGVDFGEPTNSSCTECVDHRLALNLETFGSSLTNAITISPKQVDEDLSFAVVSDPGGDGPKELKSGLGEIPLKVDPTALIAAAKSEQTTNFEGRIYIFVSKEITDSKSKTVGTIVIPRDITLQQHAAEEQLKFNLVLSASAFSTAVFIALYFIGREIVRTHQFEKLPEALNTPENLNKEFKSSFQWDISHSQQNLDERLKTLKTIAAFLNSEGGVLFIGVNDNRTIRGLEDDLKLFKGSQDRFQLQISDLISDRIGAEFFPLIKIRCESHEGKSVCVIEVEKATEPAFLKDDSKSRFYTREGGRTNELDPKETNAFVRGKRWDG
jgi:hypothetical protein